MIDRRTFVAAMSTAAITGVRVDAKKIDRLGMQLYTVRTEMEKSVEETLAKLVRVYFEHLAQPIGAQFASLLDPERLDGTTFSWAGPTTYAAPPYSWTRVRAEKPSGTTSAVAPSGDRRTITWRPASAGRDSSHHTSSPDT